MLALVLLSGCAGQRRSNPSFDITASQARRALREMAAARKPLRRPVIVLDGMGPPLAGAHFASAVRRAVGDGPVVPVQFAFCCSLEDCRRRVIATVERCFPSADPGWTTEVDVIANSMGGVVGRFAAAPPAAGRSGKRLRIARLFTISSPHRGANLAALPPLIGPLQIERRKNSASLRALEAREQPGSYELVAYVRRGDWIVGDANAAPDGLPVHWLPTPPLEDAHLLAFADPRIVADICRRLRDEEPFAAHSPEPLSRIGN